MNRDDLTLLATAPAVLLGAWGASTNSVWLVSDVGTVHRWDDSNLSEVFASPSGKQLNAITGVGTDSIFAVGSDPVAPPAPIAKFDGMDWSEALLGLARYLSDVWASGPRDAWAVGDAVLRFDGEFWSSVADGPRAGSSVWGTSPNDVWIGSAEGLHHWDGSRFTVEPWPSPGSPFDLWGRSATDLWIAAPSGIYRHDGASMRRELDVAVFDCEPTRLMGGRPDELWVVGRRELDSGGDMPFYEGCALHLDGDGWQEVGFSQAAPVFTALYVPKES